MNKFPLAGPSDKSKSGLCTGIHEDHLGVLSAELKGTSNDLLVEIGEWS